MQIKVLTQYSKTHHLNWFICCFSTKKSLIEVNVKFYTTSFRFNLDFLEIRRTRSWSYIRNLEHSILTNDCFLTGNATVDCSDLCSSFNSGRYVQYTVYSLALDFIISAFSMVFNAKLPTVFFWIFQNIMVTFHNISSWNLRG